jgi:PadR family transcriptional regulator PadR
MQQTSTSTTMDIQRPNNRKAEFYKLNRTGRRQLEREARDWEQTIAILARFLSAKEPAS